MSKRVEGSLDEIAERFAATQSCAAPASSAERKAFRRRLSSEGYHEPFRGIFVRSSLWAELDGAERSLWCMRALTALHPGYVFARESALAAYGFPVSWRHLRRLHLLGRNGAHVPNDPGLVMHQGPPAEPRVVSGVRVCGLGRATLDALCAVEFREALLVADRYLRVTGRTRDELSEQLARVRGARGIRMARCAAAYADGLSESGGESIARAVMIELGFAIPLLQVPMSDPMTPGRDYRADYLWCDAGDALVRGELDGEGKYREPDLMGGRTTLEVLTDERRRESRMSIDRVPLVRFSFAEVLDTQYFARLLDTFGVPRVPGGQRLAV